MTEQLESWRSNGTDSVLSSSGWGARSNLQRIVEANPYPFMLCCQMRDQHCRQVLQALQVDILWQ